MTNFELEDANGNDYASPVQENDAGQDITPEPQSEVHTGTGESSGTQELATAAVPSASQATDGTGMNEAHTQPNQPAIQWTPSVAPVLGTGIPSHEWSTARYPATTRQLHTLQSLSIARNIDLPFLDDAAQQINRAGASRLIEFLMRGETPPPAVINYILAEGVEPEPTEPYVWPNGDTELRTERQAQYINMLYAQVGGMPPSLDNMTQNQASAKIAELRALLDRRREIQHPSLDRTRQH